jgi:hypothetical protein
MFLPNESREKILLINRDSSNSILYAFKSLFYRQVITILMVRVWVSFHMRLINSKQSLQHVSTPAKSHHQVCLELKV